jgi:hypothetical protein
MPDIKDLDNLYLVIGFFVPGLIAFRSSASNAARPSARATSSRSVRNRSTFWPANLTTPSVGFVEMSFRRTANESIAETVATVRAAVPLPPSTLIDQVP